nr:hypothetical protein Q903MT_gene2109 [Picea sitchensis]
MACSYLHEHQGDKRYLWVKILPIRSLLIRIRWNHHRRGRCNPSEEAKHPYQNLVEQPAPNQ